MGSKQCGMQWWLASLQEPRKAVTVKGRTGSLSHLGLRQEQDLPTPGQANRTPVSAALLRRLSWAKCIHKEVSGTAHKHTQRSRV